MSKLNNELIKLISYSSKQTIELEDIEQVVKSNEEFEVFSLIGFLAQKQNDKAFVQIKKMLESKQDLNSILALIYSNIRRMFLAKTSTLNEPRTRI